MSKPDANQNAARIASEAAGNSETPLPADLEQAWSAWIAGVGKVDARAMALLRAAFEAGADAGANAMRAIILGKAS